MNQRLYTYITTVIFLLVPVSFLRAQSTALPFFEGFDGDTMSAKLNSGYMGFALTNKWCVSDYEPYMGDSCLIISNNDSAATYTGTKNNTAVAYIDFWLPSGSYDFSFSWRCLGEKDKDGLYVCWEPQSTSGINSSVGMIPPVVKQEALSFDPNNKNNKMLFGHNIWQLSECVLSIPGNSVAPVPYRLYFVWTNDDAVVSDMSVCIDNIQLATASCDKPSDLQCTLNESAAILTWSGDVDAKYEVMYRAYGSKYVDTIPDIPGQVIESSVNILDIGEGVYDFFVRKICPSGETSAWSALRNKLIYLPEARCIDFINLKSQKTECTVGSYDNPYETLCSPKDFGADDYKYSRHTMHYIPGETDPYTGGRLSTVSPNDVASVRIGNSEGGAAESVSYSYTLKPNEKIALLVDYAIVYEWPNHETVSEQPNVTIDILDENDNLINPDGLNCNEVNFYPPTKGNTLQDTTWIQQSGEPFEKKDILWRDWHTMGLNLSTLAEGITTDRKIKVRLTVRDCSYALHFAHAFFSIRCVSATLEGYSCGKEDKYSVTAPPGFTYRWYNPDNPDEILSTEQRFEVDDSKADTFMCDMIFADKSQCYFTLPAYLVPRVPVPAFTPEHSPKDCNNRLILHNTGGVMSDGALTGEQCDSVKWTITDLSTGQATVLVDSISPELYFSPQGDTIEVKLHVGISGNKCTDTKVDTVVIPSIITIDDTVVRKVCSLPYWFNSSLKCDTAGIYEIDGTNDAGCPTKMIVDIRLIEKIETTIFDTICQGDTFEFFELRLVDSTPAEGFLKTIKTADGKCDSMVYTLHLYVQPQVILTFDSLSEICAGDPYFDIPYHLVQGKVYTFGLNFDKKARDAGFADTDRAEVTDEYIRITLPTDTLRPDNYSVDLICSTDSCGIFRFPLSFTVHYPVSGIMEQKWNDVITILNSDYNYGGFEYTHYQWYKNNEIIPGATSSYIYIGSQGKTFNASDQYRVMLTRKGDVNGIISCPIIPTERTETTEYATIIQSQGARVLYIEPSPIEHGTAHWYTPSGIYCGKYPVVAADASIPLPPTSGIYILHLIFPSETYTLKVVIP